tara:strand:- start:2075 stop:3223 length:1149 start_codon:yes stop_codon:yes gene_type:complete
MSVDSKTYCPVLFDTIYSSNSNDSYNLCCFASENNELDKKYKQKTHTPFEFFLSKEMNEIRNKSLKEEKISQCTRCYNEESATGYSNRKRYIDERKGKLPYKVKNIKFKLRHFGNHCNLGCLMCHPINSTTRQKELKQIGLYKDIMNTYGETEYENLDYKSYQIFKKDIVENIEKISTFQITGGEPFQIPKVWQFLVDDVPKEYAKNINLVFDTNLTNLNYKKYNFEQLLERYRKVILNVSCDHIKDKLKFIRYPIDVNLFEKNLIKYKNYINRINVTVQLLNIFDLDIIKQYYTDYDVCTESYADHPKFLSVRNLKDEHKKQIQDNYAGYEDRNKMFFVEFTKQPLLIKSKFVDYLNSLSKHRNLDWKNIWGDNFTECLYD